MTVKKARAPKLATRFVAAIGSPISDEDASVIGPELMKIATANAKDDIRSLDKHLVLSIVEADKKHPLRPFYNWDVKEAARSHWLSHTALLIRSVRVHTVSIAKRPVPMPMFLHVPDHAKRSNDDGDPVRRRHVLTEDALANDPAFASAIGSQIRLVIMAVERLEHITSARISPREVTMLRDRLRASVDEYLGAIAVDAAAE